MKLFAVLRTALYATGFVLVWGWVALGVRRFDSLLGGPVPGWWREIGLVLMVLGGSTVLLCAFAFSVRGRGTPAPFDPPREFVASGPYGYVRNPMYLGAVLVLVGFGLDLRSPSVLILAALFLLLAHAFVVLVEEPGLERRFGASYLEYKRSVHRWWPGHHAGPR